MLGLLGKGYGRILIDVVMACTEFQLGDENFFEKVEGVFLIKNHFSEKYYGLREGL